MSRSGVAAVDQATRFFMRDDPVHRSLHAITARLSELGIAYAVAGGMSLVAHGYDRTTADVQELIRVLHLPADFSQQLDPYVRDKFAELWKSIQEDSSGAG